MNLHDQIEYLNKSSEAHRAAGRILEARVAIKERMIVEHKIAIRELQDDISNMHSSEFTKEAE